MTDVGAIRVRSAVDEDRLVISKLVHYETHVHRHLDWQAPIDWIGIPPFYVAEIHKTIVAAIACPMDLPEVAWLRLFMAADHVNYQQLWHVLWSYVHAELSNGSRGTVAAIPLYTWMVDLLSQTGFTHSNNVIILKWDSGTRMPDPRSSGSIRMMTLKDIPAVHRVDSLAFQPLWQNSEPSLALALSQSVVATVLEDESGIVGYQMSTSGQIGGHIARLAVLPEKQGQNLGYSLVYDALRQFERQLIYRVTVNTQQDNLVSQNLYRKAGFKAAGESYAVYQTNL